MKFDELDRMMRVFETAHDDCVLPEIFMVARLDGRGFTRLTKEVLEFEAPFDVRFRDLMVETTRQLMDTGFRMLYGFTESDEISLLFDRDDRSFGRKLRKLNSILAGEASARFSLALGVAACFDCRISELPTIERVVDYFRWRNEDAHRNALNAHCYWALRRDGLDAQTATRQLSGLSVSTKNELLFSRGVNFNDLPAWQRRGTGVYWETFDSSAVDPRDGSASVSVRRRLRTDFDLPMKDAYGAFVRSLLREVTDEEVRTSRDGARGTS